MIHGGIYDYPVIQSRYVPGNQPHLSHLRMLALAAGAIALLVVVITAIAVLARPITQPCGISCGPHGGLRIQAASYTNQRFGYTVEYPQNVLTLAGQDQNGAQFQAADGDGEIDFTATSGSDVSGAVSAAAGNIDTSQFQNMQQIGPVRGAEIGLVLGQGTAYEASFVPPNGGGQSVPVGLVVMAASRGGVTITVTAFSALGTDVKFAPYGLDKSQLFDFPVTNTLWKGQS